MVETHAFKTKVVSNITKQLKKAELDQPYTVLVSV